MGNGMPRSLRVTVSQAKHNQTKILNAKSARYFARPCKTVFQCGFNGDGDYVIQTLHSHNT